MTTRRSGSMGSTDGVCDGGLFISGSVQNREPSIRLSLAGLEEGPVADPPTLTGPLRESGPPDCTDISAWLAPPGI